MLSFFPNGCCHKGTPNTDVNNLICVHLFSTIGLDITQLEPLYEFEWTSRLDIVWIQFWAQSGIKCMLHYKNELPHYLYRFKFMLQLLDEKTKSQTKQLFMVWNHYILYGGYEFRWRTCQNNRILNKSSRR